MTTTAYQTWMRELVAGLRQPLRQPTTLAAEALDPLADPRFRAPELSADHPDAIDAALRIAGDALPELEDPFQAGRLAFVCGALLHHGGSATIIAPALLPVLQRAIDDCSALARTLDPEGSGLDTALDHLDDYPHAVRAWLQLESWLSCAGQLLARDRWSRQTSRARRELPHQVEELESYSPTARAITALLQAVDDLELDVIEWPSQRGHRVRTDCVLNNYHLFILLDGALPRPREATSGLDPEVLAWARGLRLQRRQDLCYARWSCSTRQAWNGERLDPDAPGAKLFGEESPATIPRVGDRPLLLLGEQPAERFWPTAAFAPVHDAQRSAATVIAELSAEQVSDTLEAAIKPAGR